MFSGAPRDINVRHGAAKPQNTVQAEKSAAKLWKVDTVGL